MTGQSLRRMLAEDLGIAVADHLEDWWISRQSLYPEVRTIMIGLDNGPEVSSRRRQFMKRMVEFADRHGVSVELVYYPPYHSKYNLIERCWGVLEQHRNGTQLKTLTDVIGWASTMTWRSVQPLVDSIDTIYAKGKTLTDKAFRNLGQFFAGKQANTQASRLRKVVISD